MPPTDPDNWQAWLARHKGALFLLARQYLPTPEEAEDAVQEGFIKFWKSRRHAVDPIAYLFTCVRSAAIDLRRSLGVRSRHQKSLTASPSPPLLECPLEQDERRSQIESALADLPPEQREIVILKIWAGLTFAQIAAALGLPLNTAASRYRYALQHLQTLLPPEVRCE